jgi:hypothetical protein
MENCLIYRQPYPPQQAQFHRRGAAPTPDVAKSSDDLAGQIVLRRAPGANEWLATIDHGKRGIEFSVFVVSARQLRSYIKFCIVVLDKSWPPYLVGKDEWRALRNRHLWGVS